MPKFFRSILDAFIIFSITLHCVIILKCHSFFVAPIMFSVCHVSSCHLCARSYTLMWEVCVEICYRKP